MEFPRLKNKLILAPMHNITNIAFRILCKKYGAGLTSTELLSANALARKDNLNLKLAETNKKEKPVCAQIFGQNTENLVKAAKILEKDTENKKFSVPSNSDKFAGFDIIDINFGCPSKKILSQGAGAALLKRKNKIKEIVEQVSKSIKKPLTVKIRSDNSVEIAKICEKAGASAITVHARSVKQGYSRKADWDVIKKVKENVKIPVIGNGDVVDGKSAEKMLKETNCNYIMIGRAAIGNPFIFKQINEYLRTGKEIRQTKKQKIEDFFEYIKLTKKYKIFSTSDAKLKAQEFTKGVKGSRELRGRLNTIKTWDEIEKLIKSFQSQKDIMNFEEKFHISRRMFCIRNKKLIIAEPNSTLSHQQWFEKNKWGGFNETIRGFVDEKKDIYFCISDFEINPQAESDFFSILAEIVNKLSLSYNSKIFGGFVKGQVGERWLPKKDYGAVSDYLER